MKTVEEKVQELLSLRDIDNLRIFKEQKKYVLVLYYKTGQPPEQYSDVDLEHLISKVFIAYTTVFG